MSEASVALNTAVGSLPQFMSGEWTGYWEQSGTKGWMTPLHLSFTHGRISGSGTDWVGTFTMTGSYDSAGHVVIAKQYVGMHRVDYIGDVDRKGIRGKWHLPLDCGEFRIWPKAGGCT